MLKLLHEHPTPHTAISKWPRLKGRLFRYYCVAHRERSVDRSPVTIYDGAWAYCPNGYGRGHDWVAIEPVTDVQLLQLGAQRIRRSDRARHSALRTVMSDGET